MAKYELTLCEKCEHFIFPEVDEDGIVAFGCRHPKVIDTFQNFIRKEKGKYYKPISYIKFKIQVLRFASQISNWSFNYRDPKRAMDDEIWFKRNTRICSIYRIHRLLEEYYTYREYLFKLEPTEKEKEILELISDPTFYQNDLEDYKSWLEGKNIDIERVKDQGNYRDKNDLYSTYKVSKLGWELQGKEDKLIKKYQTLKCISCDKKLTDEDKEDPLKEMCDDCFIFEMGITWNGMYDELNEESEEN